MADHMLTTVDNPHNPWSDYDEWLAWDTRAGHHTNALLARIVVSSDELSEALQAQAIEDAISEIVYENVSGLHRKVAAPNI